MDTLALHFAMKAFVFVTQDISRTERELSVIPNCILQRCCGFLVRSCVWSLQKTKRGNGFAAPAPMTGPNVNISEQSTVASYFSQQRLVNLCVLKQGTELEEQAPDGK